MAKLTLKVKKVAMKNIATKKQGFVARVVTNGTEEFKHGYLVAHGDDIIYYDDETNRRPLMESKAHLYGLTVRAWTD